MSNDFKLFWDRNGQAILTWGSRACTVAAPFAAAWGTNKTIQTIQELNLTKKWDIVRKCWVYYIPTAALVGGAIAMDCASESKANSSIAALGSLVSTLRANNQVIENKAKELLTDEEKKKFDDEVTKALAPLTSKHNTPIATQYGSYLFEDVWSGIQFYGNADHITNIKNGFEERRRMGADIYLEEWYEALGIDDRTVIKAAEGLIWPGAKPGVLTEPIRIEITYGSDGHRNPIGYVRFLSIPRSPHEKIYGVTGFGVNVNKYEI